MKSPVLLTLGAACLLAGCADYTYEAETARLEQERADHAYCVDYGTVPGTAAYDRCRDSRAGGNTYVSSVAPPAYDSPYNSSRTYYYSYNYDPSMDYYGYPRYERDRRW
jgi:hypothetical protein